MATALSDVASALAAEFSVLLDTYGGATDGEPVDLSGGDVPGVGILVVGGLEDGTTVSVHLEQSATGATGWADIPGAAFPDVAAGQSLRFLPFVRSARYVRAVLGLAGPTPAATLAVIVGQQKKTV
jgi:hypothetical protein